MGTKEDEKLQNIADAEFRETMQNNDIVQLEIPITDETAKKEIEEKKEKIKTAIFDIIRKVSKLSIKYKDYKEDWSFIQKKCEWIRKHNRCHTCLLYRSGCLYYDKWKKRWEDE